MFLKCFSSKWFRRHVESNVSLLVISSKPCKAPLSATKLVPLLFRHFLRVFEYWRHLAQADECGQEGRATRRCVPGRSRAAASRAAHACASHTTAVHRTAGEGGRALRGQPTGRDARRPEEGTGRTGIASTTSNTPANVQYHAATALRVCMQHTCRSGLAWYSACCKARPNKAASLEHVGQSCCKMAYA